MPTFTDILWKSAGLSADKLIAILTAAAAAVPELEAEAKEIIAKIKAARIEENLVALAVVVPSELKNILQGRIDPRSHPSDAA